MSKPAFWLLMALLFVALFLLSFFAGALGEAWREALVR